LFDILLFFQRKGEALFLSLHGFLFLSNGLFEFDLVFLNSNENLGSVGQRKCVCFPLFLEAIGVCCDTIMLNQDYASLRQSLEGISSLKNIVKVEIGKDITKRNNARMVPWIGLSPFFFSLIALF
jgi:hypothetical protein